MLVREGVAACRRVGSVAIVVLGDPAYYRRFGFRSEAAAGLRAPFSGPAFMALELSPGSLDGGGEVRYARAFGL
jgi:putative acetyltransferase